MLANLKKAYKLANIPFLCKTSYNRNGMLANLKKAYNFAYVLAL